MGIKTATDWGVLAAIVVGGGIIGYLGYRNEKNSDGKSDFESMGKTVKSIYEDATEKMTFAGGSATKRHKKHRKSKGKRRSLKRS